MRLPSSLAGLLMLPVFGFGIAPRPTPLASMKRRQSQSASQQTAPQAQLDGAARLRDEIKVVEGLLTDSPGRAGLADRGAALYLLAHHDAHLGYQVKALALLKECVALGEGFDPSEARAFAPLKNNPEFRQLAEHVRSEFPPVHHAQVAFTVAQSDLFPEGLGVDAAKRVFLMSSMHHNKIVQITGSGEAAD